MISYRLYQGDSLDLLMDLSSRPEEQGKYRVIVTSPPYFGHRHYGHDPKEIGQEITPDEYIEKLADIFLACKDLLAQDGSLWIVIGDTRRKNRKLMIPHRLAIKLDRKYTFREDVIWYKKNNVSSSSKDNFSQSYEPILFLSKNEKCFTNMQEIRIRGNEAREGRNKVPPKHLLQYAPLKEDKTKIENIKEIIHRIISKLF